MSLVDPSYELVDPCPDLHASFLQFNKQFFDGKLASCEIVWSKRMTKCAGLCQYHPRSGYCSIRLSEPLLKLRPRKDFVETLLHEMIHAFLFLTSRVMDRDGHGPNFQFHMHRINKIAGTNITIYHSFHAEVRLYQQHWWRCDGPCKSMKPFYGWVKRSMNRAPSKNDFWWANHQKICGGNFIKVKEPEKTEKAKSSRKRKSDDKKEGDENVDNKPKITSHFPGKGYVLGSGDEGNNEKKNVKIKKTPVKTPKKNGNKTPKKSPPFSKRFPGSGQKLGGDSVTPSKKTRLISDFFVKVDSPSSSKLPTPSPTIPDETDVSRPSTSNENETNELLKTPENVKKPDLSQIKSPELIQLEHDDFGWDDEEIIVLDEIEIINEKNDNKNVIPVRIGNTVYIDEEDLTFDDIIAAHEQKLLIQPRNAVPKVKEEILTINDDGLEIVMEKVKKTEEIVIINEVKRPAATVKIDVQMADCPICTIRIPLNEINSHLDLCIT